jgi:hypothetical protein
MRSEEPLTPTLLMFCSPVCCQPLWGSKCHLGILTTTNLTLTMANHRRCITLQPFGTPLFPHHINFEHNFASNQHYIYGLHNDTKPPTTPYGWPLEAVPFIGPSLSPYTVNNDAMGIYKSQYLNAHKVDIALYMLDDYGVTADVDHYRGLMLDYEVLQARQKQLELDLCQWHKKVGPLCQCLNLSQARSHLHPYLERQTPIPTPPSYYHTHGVKPTSPHALTMDQALAIDPSGVFCSDCPWYHECFAVNYTFAELGSHCYGW